jgi:hypothetical protein
MQTSTRWVSLSCLPPGEACRASVIKIAPGMRGTITIQIDCRTTLVRYHLAHVSGPRLYLHGSLYSDGVPLGTRKVGAIHDRSVDLSTPQPPQLLHSKKYECCSCFLGCLLVLRARCSYRNAQASNPVLILFQFFDVLESSTQSLNPSTPQLLHSKIPKGHSCLVAHSLARKR